MHMSRRLSVLVLAVLGFAAIAIWLSLAWHDARQEAAVSERAAAAPEARGGLAVEVEQAHLRSPPRSSP